MTEGQFMRVSAIHAAGNSLSSRRVRHTTDSTWAGTPKGLNSTAKNLIPTAQIKCDNLNAFVFKQSYKLILLFSLLFYEAMHTIFFSLSFN